MAVNALKNHVLQITSSIKKPVNVYVKSKNAQTDILLINTNANVDVKRNNATQDINLTIQVVDVNVKNKNVQ